MHVIAGDDYRRDYALQLYQEGYAKQVFFTGVPLHVIVSDDSEVMSTYMEAERLKEWIDKDTSAVESMIVVNDPFHMRRVSGDQIQIHMEPVPFDRTPYQRIWWKDALSRKSVEEEYFKFVFYLFRYKYSWGFIRHWLVSFDMH